MDTLAAPWTAPEIETLIRDWQSGKSASLIAAELRRSRNAVCGKVHRLGLPLGATQRIQMRAPSQSRRPLLTQPIQNDPPGKPHKPVRLFNLRSHHCRALLDASNQANPLYCGKPTVWLASGARSSYCAEHHKKFHQRRAP
ncbi:hypothetical protein I6F35_02955 [Bradyrhizobium sp. BRP22]|uniref:GcrA family cell cycle regulator n=1 Tax=Bradyrhizobium sp. BRP22 TaxID=2793821 RepID=UPI001CD1CFF8|nr:GcrA family cell cycle regulator [Bradyrhizobium sp. BRP22]MCA1452174.1 hypothetical protein [Bradyrhizobium sp. BRP22]